MLFAPYQYLGWWRQCYCLALVSTLVFSAQVCRTQTPVYLSKSAKVFLFHVGNESEQQKIKTTKERMKSKENFPEWPPNISQTKESFKVGWKQHYWRNVEMRGWHTRYKYRINRGSKRFLNLRRAFDPEILCFLFWLEQRLSLLTGFRVLLKVHEHQYCRVSFSMVQTSSQSQTTLKLYWWSIWWEKKERNQVLTLFGWLNLSVSLEEISPAAQMQMVWNKITGMDCPKRW